MIVGDLRCEATPDGWRLSASITSPSTALDGQRLHFAVREAEESWLRASGDPFVAALLMPAMALGEELVVAAPVSPRLLRSLPAVASIYRSWWGDQLGAVAVRATPVPSEPSAPGVGLFFTTGVDAFYSLLKDGQLAEDPGHEPVSHLLYADFEGDDGDDHRRLLSRLRRAAVDTGKKLVVVDTNVRAITARIVGWAEYHGAALASTALALQGLMHRCLIASSQAYWELVPWGSHPLLDHLWSTEALELVHDGAEANRTDKIMRYVARSPTALENLSVCWQSRPGHNCGACEKCIRTMISFELAGTLDRCPTLPGPLDLGRIRHVLSTAGPRHMSEPMLVQIRYLTADARRYGRHDIADAIDDGLSSYA